MIGTSSYLPGFDFVLVVILKYSFIAQTQPPWDPLLVLKHTKKKHSGKVVCKTERESTNSFISKSQTAYTCRSSVNKKCVFNVYEKREGRVVKLYLYGIVMYSICRERLYNAHVTAKNRKTVTKNKADNMLSKHDQ